MPSVTGHKYNCEIPWERVQYLSDLEVCHVHDEVLYKSTFTCTFTFTLQQQENEAVNSHGMHPPQYR